MSNQKPLSITLSPSPALTEKPKSCPTCSTPLKSGIKYEDKCTTCEPIYLNRCSGCQRQLWDCMCIRPHTWE
jgi:hypothetical protein